MEEKSMMEIIAQKTRCCLAESDALWKAINLLAERIDELSKIIDKQERRIEYLYDYHRINEPIWVECLD